MQRNFLHQLECSECEAFVEHNSAPSSLRRALAILGFLHKRVLGICHPALIKALPYDPDMSFRYHSKTLAANFDQLRAYPALYRNSLWDYIHIYNRFPPRLTYLPIIDSPPGLIEMPFSLRCHFHCPQVVGSVCTRTRSDIDIFGT